VGEAPVRERVLEGVVACVGRFGLAKTTVDDVARESGVSRATIYRYFPGGRDQLEREAVAWEMGRFFLRLGEAVAGAPDLAAMVEEGLVFARRAILAHEVLQRVLVTEPDRLLPLMTINSDRVLRMISGYLVPWLEREQAAGRLVEGADVDRSADWVAHMVLSLIASPGSCDLEDRHQVRRLVREQMLAGVLRPVGA
jgi:AcrR family transcriptional regulator